MNVGSQNVQQRLLLAAVLVSSMAAAGCHSPYHADRGALFGGLTGTGIGALVGEAVGKPLAGAALGAGVGTMTGAAVGGSLDEIEARNRAAIEARLGRPVSAGAVGFGDVVSMVQAGVDDDVIVNHIRAHGVAGPLQTDDLIMLKNNGVSAKVIKAMQQPPARPAVVHEAAPRQVIVEEHYYHDPWRYLRPHYRYHHHHHRHRHHSPRLSWGLSLSSDH